jgi:hypothetical protein
MQRSRCGARHHGRFGCLGLTPRVVKALEHESVEARIAPFDARDAGVHDFDRR